ncbi:hypothetical protein ABTE96_20930, partial [Acinetobacter baumannii]
MKQILIGLFAIAAVFNSKQVSAQKKTATTPAPKKKIELPEPYATESVKRNSKVIGWPEGKTPGAPAGFVVTKFADKLNSPRW